MRCFGRVCDFKYWYSESDAAKGLKSEILWQKVVYMAILHICALYGTFVIGMYIYENWEDPVHIMKVILLQEFIQSCGGFGVTGGVHRYWSHRSYKAHPVVQFA